MSKTGKKDYIYYNPSSTIKINGYDKAGISINPNGTKGWYNMSEDEKDAYDYAEKEFALNLPKINVFSDETRQELNNRVKEYINSGAQNINETYRPMIQELQEDIASRFGNLDNSVFLDNLNKIEDKRSDAISELSNNAEIYRQDIINDELAKRYNYLDFLNDYKQETYENILNTLAAGQGISNTSNSYFTNMNNTINGSTANNQSVDYEKMGRLIQVIASIFSSIAA